MRSSSGVVGRRPRVITNRSRLFAWKTRSSVVVPLMDVDHDHFHRELVGAVGAIIRNPIETGIAVFGGMLWFCLTLRRFSVVSSLPAGSRSTAITLTSVGALHPLKTSKTMRASEPGAPAEIADRDVVHRARLARRGLIRRRARKRERQENRFHRSVPFLLIIRVDEAPHVAD